MLETVSTAQAQETMPDLIKSANESHRPILITAQDGNAVLLSEEDWNALQETVQMLTVPALRESIVRELNRPDNDFLSEEEFFAELGKDGEN